MITPSVPSEPIKRLFRSKPATSLRTGPPTATSSPRGDDDLEPTHPRTGDAVLERVRATRVRRDVAADLRILRRARVGREEETALAHQTAEVGRPQTGLDLDSPEERIEGVNDPEPIESEDDAARKRHGSAGEAGSTAPRDDRDLPLVAPGDDLGHLVPSARKDDRGGFPCKPAGLGLVMEESGRRGFEDVLGSDDQDEVPADRGLRGHLRARLGVVEKRRPGFGVEEVESARVER